MELFKEEIGKIFKMGNFKKSFALTWLFVGAGIILLVSCNLIADVMPAKSYFSYFFKDAGIFLMITSLLMAFAGVYRVTALKNGEVIAVRESLKSVAEKSHYILGISFGTLLIFLIVVLLEVGFSSVSHIPYAGPFIAAILTIPIFVINLLCLILTICIFAVVPPMVGEAQNIKDFLNELKIIIWKRGLNVVIYVIISLSILAVSMVIIFFIFKFSVGITKAVQWKINAAYPKIISKKFAQASFLTDLVYRITPRPDPVAAFRKYGFKLFDYLNMLKFIISLSYMIVISFIVSFPLSVYFNFSSSFFRRILKRKS